MNEQEQPSEVEIKIEDYKSKMLTLIEDIEKARGRYLYPAPGEKTAEAEAEWNKLYDKFISLSINLLREVGGQKAYAALMAAAKQIRLLGGGEIAHHPNIITNLLIKATEKNSDK